MSTNAPFDGFSNKLPQENQGQSNPEPSFEPMSPEDFRKIMVESLGNKAGQQRRGRSSETDFQDTDPQGDFQNTEPPNYSQETDRGHTTPATLPGELERKKTVVEEILTPQEFQDLRRRMIEINSERRKKNYPRLPSTEGADPISSSTVNPNKSHDDTQPINNLPHTTYEDTQPINLHKEEELLPNDHNVARVPENPVVIKQTPVRGGLVGRGIAYGKKLLARSSRKMFNRSAETKDGHHGAPQIKSASNIEKKSRNPIKKIMRNGRFTSLLGKRNDTKEDDEFDQFLDEFSQTDEVKAFKELDSQEATTQPQALEHKKQEEVKRENLLRRGLDKLTTTTREKRNVVLKELGPEGSRLVSLLDKGAHFLDKQVRKEVRLATGVSLAVAGALAVYATPAIGTVAVITAAGVGARVLSASAAYVGIQRFIDKMVAHEENFNATRRDDDDPLRNLKIGKTERALFGLAGALGASMLGQLIGEYLAPSLGNVLKNYFPNINEPLIAISRSGLTFSKVPTPNDIGLTTITPPEIPIVASVTPDVLATPPVETFIPSLPPEILHHTMKPGENLWVVIKNIMETQNLEGFNDLAQEKLKEAKIAEIVGKISINPQAFGIESGDINYIQAGKVIDLTKAFIK